MTRRAVYLHYSNRAELLGALLQSLGQTEELGASLQQVWDAPDAVSAVDEWARHLAWAHPRILPIARAVEQVRRTDPDAAALRENMMDRWRKGCRRLVTWLDDEGRLAPEWTVDAAADMIWALMSWDVLEGLLDDRGWSRDEYAERLALLLRSTFVHDPTALLRDHGRSGADPAPDRSAPRGAVVVGVEVGDRPSLGRRSGLG